MPQDHAVTWYRLAADQDEADAQFILGAMYANGRGVPQDYIQAYKWFSLSEARGNEEAEKSLANCAGHMTSAQITEARQLVVEWKPYRLE